MPQEEQYARIDYIDVFRSFGILLMVMGHIGYGDAFDFFIHAFHMPMFFWISGYLYKHRSKEEVSLARFVLKKAKSLLLPYCVFGLAHYLLYVVGKMIMHDDIDISPLFHLFSVNTIGLPICGAIWFLTALFFTDVMFFVIDRYVENQNLKAVIVGMIAIAGNVAKIVLPFTLPFALGVSFVGLGLYYLGYLFKKNRKNKYIGLLLNLPWLPNILLGFLTAILIFTNGYINMRSGTYSVIPLFWLNALLSIIVGINFARWIYSSIENNLIGKWLRGIGRDSIVYVCLNQVVILILTQCLNAMSLPVILSKILILILTLLILLISSKIITCTKLRVLIGK